MFTKGHRLSVGNKGGRRPTKAEEVKEASVLLKLQIELARVQVALADKKLTGEKYKDLIDAADKLIKNIQLLGGNPTENVAVQISKEIAEKYDINIEPAPDSNLPKQI